MLASCSKLSRSKAKKLIEAGLVTVDNVIVTKAEKAVQAGCVISANRKKRLVIVSIDGPTKKGRFRLKYNYS